MLELPVAVLTLLQRVLLRGMRSSRCEVFACERALYGGLPSQCFGFT